jgi:3-isopropylmalate dehydrogenase
MITGSIGMIPSSSLGDTTCGLYEPIHGSAPDIAGMDIANPIGTILAAAMMLRFSFDMPAEADAVENAVSAVLTDGWRCADIMPESGAENCRKIGCRKMGDRIAAYVEKGV